jgi:high-affinity nickel-transport protein
MQIEQQAAVRRRIIAIYALLIAFTVSVWAWALVALRGHAVLIGTAVVAYGFGLRHAVDADHIAAIDNVTRKLMQQGKRPVAAGLFFALGHSSVVLIAAAAVALGASVLGDRFHPLRQIGGTIGTIVSFGFLWLIAGLNLFGLRGTWVAFRRVRQTGRYEPEDLDMLVAQGGFAARCFRPLFGLMRCSWHMFPLGFLFGLGFETATEVTLLGMSAEQASQGMSLASILLFPALFTAGMTLIDTTDGALMTGVYGWAFVNPIRKLYYNITITLTSAVVALVVGGVEALGLMSDHFAFTGRFWNAVAGLTRHFGSLGYAIIGLFIACWLVSIGIYRLRRYDEIPPPCPAVKS